MSLAVPLALVVAGAVLALAADVPALPALHCPTDATVNLCKEYSSTRFRVEGSDLRFAYNGGNLLRLKCTRSLQLDSVRAFLPRFTPALHVGHVTVTDCPPAPYAAVLAALNVMLTSPFNLKLYGTKKTLTAAHFAELPPLHRLTLLDGGVVRGLPGSLEGLIVENMKLPNNTLEALPRTLTELRLDRMDITRVPAAVLDLPELRSLHVANDKPRNALTVERGNASQLQQLYVAGADAALMSEWAPPLLEEVTLEYWRAERPKPIPACDKLVNLSLLTVDAQAFPTGWLARCPRLENLYITGAFNVVKLPAGLLENATQLKDVRIHGTETSTLPAQLFADTPHLTHLDLNYNHVKELPSQLFAGTPHLTYLNFRYNYLAELPPLIFADIPRLTHLDLSDNRLNELPPQLFANTPHLTHLALQNNRLIQLPSALLTLPLLSLDLGYNSLNASVVAELASFTELRNLSLAGNRELGDVCDVTNSGVPGKSPLASLSKLERLKLYSTSISVICSDWREDMVNLEYLDLSYTKLGNVTYEEMLYNRNVPAVVELSGTLHFTADDYDKAAAAAALAPPKKDVTIVLNMKIVQPCRLYWLTNALNSGLMPVNDVVDDNFNSKLSLSTVRTEGLLCPSRESCATLPSDCDCGMAGADRGLLRVLCIGTKLDRVPRLQSLAADVDAVDLVLANNAITELVVDDLPPHLRVLDLRNNSISYMTATTARALVSGTQRRVLLAGNRLECSCRATPALRVLRDHAAVLVGYDSLRCEDGGTLEGAIDACSIPALR